MKNINLSEWALSHQPLVLYLMLVLLFIGASSYSHLGQSEDPPFTLKVMVVSTVWPGATAQEVEQQITDRLEKTLQETPHLDYLRSYSKPGESVIFILLKDSTQPADVPDIWYQVRKKVGDMRHTLPQGSVGPFFNDDFSVIFGNIFALTGDGYSYAQLRHFADQIRTELLRVNDVERVELIGVQDEKIYIDLSNTKLATLGLDLQTIVETIQQQNAKLPTSAFETATDKIYLRADAVIDSVDSLREITIRAAGRSIRLGDIAHIYRGYVEPPAPKMRFMGHDAVGIGVSMTKEGDIIELGHNLDHEIARLRQHLPVGMELQQVTNQPRAVANSVNLFMRTLIEAVAIVLGVSFFSLGWRPGMVVALTIPLVLAATFMCMRLLDIGLNKMSLGALILALGLLVDDAIIAVEMMAVKIEQGMDRLKAASFAYKSTALPMFSGTLVTASGFLPIATAASSTGEYVRPLFQVTVISLLVSWVAAVIFVPYLGLRILPNPAKSNTATGDESNQHVDEYAVYQKPFYLLFRRLVTWCVRHRWVTIGFTVASLALALYGFNFIQQQYFVSSTRPILLVDMRLAEGSSLSATAAQAKKFEEILLKEPGIEHFVDYIGTGSPRFYLSQEMQMTKSNFAQFIIEAKGIEEHEALRKKLIKLFANDFTELRAVVSRLENGPPIGFPVQFRVSGPDLATVRSIAAEVAEKMRLNPYLSNVQFDWDEPSKIVRLDIDQEKARALGLSTLDLLHNSLNGFSVTHYREGDQQIEVLLRSAKDERANLSMLADMAVPTRVGKSVPLGQIARISYGFEEGIIWRRNRLPSINVMANLYGDIQAPAVSMQVSPTLDAIRAKLPIGYLLETGGMIEESDKGSRSVAAGMPLFLLVALTVLILQLRDFSRTSLVLLTAPLGIIGVSLFLLIFDLPYGFVAMLGSIALSGMIMRNSIILVDQIEQDEVSGKTPWDSIIDSTVRRFRPIMLTGLAAILAMIPLTRSSYFAPMAVSIMGGLMVATVLTLLFLPALYAAWFRVREEHPR